MKKIPILIALILITLNTQAQEEIYDCTFLKYTKSINGVIDEKESKGMTEAYQAADKRIRMEKKGKNINTKSYTDDDINNFSELDWKIAEIDSQGWATKKIDLVSTLDDRDEFESHLVFLFENNILVTTDKSEKVNIEGKKTVVEENMFYSCRQRGNNVFQSSHKEKFDYDEAAAARAAAHEAPERNGMRILYEDDSDTIGVEIIGKGDTCRLDYDSTGTIYKGNCKTFKNSKGVRIYCSTKKKVCKTYAEVKAAAMNQ